MVALVPARASKNVLISSSDGSGITRAVHWQVGVVSGLLSIEELRFCSLDVADVKSTLVSGR